MLQSFKKSVYSARTYTSAGHTTPMWLDSIPGVTEEVKIGLCSFSGKWTTDIQERSSGQDGIATFVHVHVPLTTSSTHFTVHAPPPSAVMTYNSPFRSSLRPPILCTNFVQIGCTIIPGWRNPVVSLFCNETKRHSGKVREWARR